MRPESAGHEIRAEQVGLSTLAVAFLVLRAFSSCCTALTGTESISNGVSAFREPKTLNAAKTMAMMGAISITLFSGVTVPALIAGVRFTEHTCDLVGFAGNCGTDPQRTVVARLAAAVFGGDQTFFFWCNRTGTDAP